ncbi:tetratricopeptide repeat protein [Nocardia rhizosphaerihabitans]|uniref:tetratricopeptide repeat protein n=1 Tax=Nocardia rhizosphaerihabitans TaxID=1691570 RepID=UPI00366D47CB
MTAVGRPWRIFLSHTGDLRIRPPGRSWIDAAEDAVKRMRHAPVDMRYFTADTRPSAALCAELVGACDIYVGIIGQRYGSPVRDDPRRSYTELEFDTATVVGKRRLVLFVADDAPDGPDPRQLAFRSKLRESGLTTATVATPDALEAALIQALAQLMLDDAAPAAAAAPVAVRRPRQLPYTSGSFTDRTDERGRLAELLAGVAPRPIGVVTGPPGVGKSSLALYVAREVSEHFPDGQLYLDLHGYSALPVVSECEALDWFVRSLDETLPPSPLDGPRLTQRYRELLDGRRVLVVLDNALTTQQVLPLLPPPGCATLVTTRGPLSNLVVRERAVRTVLRPLAPADARALLRNASGTEEAEIEDDSAAAAEVARLCGYLPLALTIAAEHAALTGATMAELAAELAGERRRLDALTGVDDDPTAEVRVVFSWSYRNLPEDLRRAFRLLGLHPGGELGTAAAAALLDLPPDRARRVLDSLVAFNVLERSARDRYRFHDLLREYAAERVAEDEPEHERHAAAARELEWYTRATDAADRLLAPARRHVPLGAPSAGIPAVSLDTYEDALRWCDGERANLTAAVRAGTESTAPDFAWRLALAAVTYYKIRRHYGDWLATSEFALVAARASCDRFGEQWCLTSLGGALAELGRSQEAWSAYQDSLRINREIGDRTGEAMALGNLGDIARQLGRHDDALAFGDEARVILAELGDRRNEALITQDVLAGTHFDRGEYGAALVLLEEAREACHGLDPLGEGTVLHDLGRTLAAMARKPEAADIFEESLAVRRACGDRHGEAETLETLGEVRLQLGDEVGGRSALLQSLAVYVELGSDRAEILRARCGELGDGAGSG